MVRKQGVADSLAYLDPHPCRREVRLGAKVNHEESRDMAGRPARIGRGSCALGHGTGGYVPGRLLQSSLGTWLNEFEWDCWCTWTFDSRFGPTGPSPDRCLYHTRNWIEHLPGAPIGYFVAVERGTGGRVHSHGLLRFKDSFAPRRKSLFGSWKARFGRNRVLPYNREKGATYYVAKYITKEPLHWDLGGHILNR